MSIDQYILCSNDCTLRYIEALAMIGLVVDVQELECEKPRFKKINVSLFDGRIITSACYLDDEVRHSIKIIRTYIDIAKRNNAIGKLQVIDVSKGIE